MNKAVKRIHADIQRLHKAQDARHKDAGALDRDEKSLNVDQRQRDHLRDRFQDNKKALGKERDQLSKLLGKEKDKLAPLASQEKKLQAEYDASVDPATGQGDPALQAQLDAIVAKESRVQGRFDARAEPKRAEVETLKGKIDDQRKELKADDRGIKSDHHDVKRARKAWHNAGDRVDSRRKKAHADLRPAEYKMDLAHTNKVRKELGLKKVDQVIRPDSGSEKVVHVAKKYLGKYESQLQAEGVTERGVPTSESCANFVTSMLQKAGAINFHTNLVSDLNNQLRSRGWHTVSLKDAKPGDVWICNGAHGEQHTEIVASNKNGHITLIGSNNHPNPGNQQINYDSSSAYLSGSFILAPRR